MRLVTVTKILAVSFLASCFVPVPAGAVDAETDRISGTYELSICKSGCSLTDSHGVFSSVVVVLLDRTLSDEESKSINRNFRADGPPNGCYSVTNLAKAQSYVQIETSGVTAWKLEKGKLAFALFRSPDAGYWVSLELDGDALKGKGASGGAGVANPGYSKDMVFARRVGPADISKCKTAAARASELIDRFLHETYSWKQLDVADELGRIAEPADLATLEPMLAHDDRHIRGNVAYLFARTGDPRGLDALFGILADRSTHRIINVEQGNFSRPGAKQTPAAMAAQITEDRYYAVHLLGRLRDPRSLDVLIPLLDHDEVNYNVAWALGQFLDQRAIPPLIAALSNEDALVRTTAIGSLVRLRATEALPAIEALFDDPALPSAGERVTVGATARRAATTLRGQTAGEVSP